MGSRSAAHMVYGVNCMACAAAAAQMAFAERIAAGVARLMAPWSQVRGVGSVELGMWSWVRGVGYVELGPWRGGGVWRGQMRNGPHGIITDHMNRRLACRTGATPGPNEPYPSPPRGTATTEGESNLIHGMARPNSTDIQSTRDSLLTYLLTYLLT